MDSDRRKKKLVNISVQKAIALRIAAHSVLFAWSVYLVCICMLHFSGSTESDESLAHIRTICLTAIGVSVVVMLPAIIYDSIKFSHRLAGPIVRLRNTLPSVGLEEIDHVGLRKRDYWQDFAAEFNAMLDRVEVLRQRAVVATPPDSDPANPNPFDAASRADGACAGSPSGCA